MSDAMSRHSNEAFEELGELAGEGYQEDLVDGIIEEMPFSSSYETLDELEELED